MANKTQNAVSTPATNNVEFVIDTKITADGKVTVALNGKKMSLKKAIADLVEADAQIVKIRNEQGETFNYLFNDPFGLNPANLYFYWSFKTNFVDRIARGELDPKTGEPKSLTATTNTVETENTEVTDNKEETKMTNQTQNAVSTPAIEIQAGTISICADAVGNGRVVVKVYGKHECAPAKLDDIAAEMPRLSDIHIIASDNRNFNAKAASYNGRYYAKTNVYIFTNTSHGNDNFKKMYKFDTAKEAVRKLARQELDDKIITAEELEILLAADREIERQREAKREAERAEFDAEWAKYEHARHFAAKIALDSKSVDDNFRHCIYCAPQQPVQTALAESREDDNTDVFDLLPTVDELNDVDTDEVKTTSELVAEMNAKIDRIIAEFDREQAEAQKSVALAELKAAIDNVPLPGKDVELWKERNKVAAEINKLYKIEELLTVDEFNAKLHILQEKLKDVDEQITACQNADKEPKIPAAELKAKYDASDDEDERVNIAIEAYRNYIEPKIKQQERKIAEQVCASLTADAPRGWTVTFTDDGNYKVTNNGLSTAILETITAGDFMNPKEFFAKFNPTQEQIDDERESLLRQLYNERDQLLNMRADLVKDFPDEKERLKILDDMLHENDLSITALESLCTRPGMVKSNPKELWF